MRAIVTGGAGFIGSHLVEFLLKKKYKIIVIDNLSTGRKENLKHFSKKITFINSDLSKKGKWINYFKNIDCVFHLAALADIVPSIQFPEKYFQSNVVSTLNILEFCKKFNVKKLIYAASSSCYGIPKEYPTSENNTLDPKYFYALSNILRCLEFLIIRCCTKSTLLLSCAAVVVVVFTL
jgi:UDP-glucose 4-epimerase